MEIELIRWKENFSQFSAITNGKLKLEKNASIGYSADFLNYIIEINDNILNKTILINQMYTGGLEIGSLSKLNYTCSFNVLDSFYLHLFLKNFFSKFFSKSKFITCLPEFDEKYGIDTNDEILSGKILTQIDIVNFLYNNPTVLMHINSEKNICTIQLKNLQCKLYSIDELNEFYKIFKLILKCF